jgi:hypothetical protein
VPFTRREGGRTAGCDAGTRLNTDFARNRRARSSEISATVGTFERTRMKLLTVRYDLSHALQQTVILIVVLVSVVATIIIGERNG